MIDCRRQVVQCYNNEWKLRFQFSALDDLLFWESLYCWCHCWLFLVRVSPLSAAFFPLLAASRAPIKQTQMIDRLILILIIFLDFSIMSLLNNCMFRYTLLSFCQTFCNLYLRNVARNIFHRLKLFCPNKEIPLHTINPVNISCVKNK